MWNDGEVREPMTDADYAVWLEETREKIARSLADPRPSIPLETAFAQLEQELERLPLPDDAAA